MTEATDAPDRQPGISAVLSVYNQHHALENAILDTTAVLDGLVDGAAFEIVVVDDASTDATPELLAEVAVRRPNLPLRVVRHAARHGVAEAMASGFDAAREELIFCMPVDGQFEVSELNRLLDSLDETTDLVIGCRDGRAESAPRRLRHWAYNRLVNLLFGHTARDVNCDFKLFRREVWQRLRSSDARLRPETFNAELLVRARRYGFRVREVSVRHFASEQAHTPSVFGPSFLALLKLRRQLDSAPGGQKQPVSIGRRAA